MILAHCLIIHFLGRGWRYDIDSQQYTAEDLIHRKIGNHFYLFYFSLPSFHIMYLFYDVKCVGSEIRLLKTVLSQYILSYIWEKSFTIRPQESGMDHNLSLI